ncbi:MAG TPA: acyl carrier protein [Burkholderiaceae bacterium]|jgi:acyl carrier protein
MTTQISTPNVAAPQSTQLDEDRIAHWLRQYVAKVLALPENDINPTTSFHYLGLDSSSAVAMTGDLADWLGCAIDASAAYDHPNIVRLSKAVAALPQRARQAA